jgi:hypothetical protein
VGVERPNPVFEMACFPEVAMSSRVREMVYTYIYADGLQGVYFQSFKVPRSSSKNCIQIAKGTVSEYDLTILVLSIFGFFVPSD